MLPSRSPSTTSSPPTVSRRSFLGRVAAALGVSGVLAACGGGGGTGGEDGTGSAEVVAAESCLGYATLQPADLRQRSALGYVDDSQIPTQHCTNCRFYNAPDEMAPCGGCQLFSGPVSPGGYCTSWAAQIG